MYRISVTSLEKFRRYMNEVSPFDTEESLIHALSGTFKGNDKTKVGEAFHKLIEGEFVEQGKMFLADEILFTNEQASVAFKFRQEHPIMIHEVSLYKVYETAYGPIQVSGRVDGLKGMQIHDHKCKFRNVKWKEYTDSIQWKIYLDIMNVDTFLYNVFEVKGFLRLPTSSPFELGQDVMFIPHEPMHCLRYSTMQDDIGSLLNEFLAYIHNRNLFHYLKPAVELPADFE
jgi:hypothetical protein